MELPVVATVEIQGERVQVRAAPLSLLSEIAQAKDAEGTVRFELVAKTLSRCCALAEGGGPLDLDVLSLPSATRLFRIAIGDEVPEGAAAPDFPQPPGSQESGG